MRMEEDRNLFIDLTDLKYNVYNGTTELKSTELTPVVIVHGAFDCKENWKEIAETIAEKTNRKVYVLDIRNHGNSHWSPVVSYEALFGDVKKFVEQLNKSIVLIGHGLGGTLAIDLALKKPEMIETLISIEMSPLHFPFSSDEMTLIIRTMKIGLSNVPKYFTIEEAKKQLKEYFDNHGMESSVQELVFPTLNKTGFGFDWKTNLTYIGGFFVNQTIEKRYPLSGIYNKPHLLIHSQLSKYIKKEDYEDIRKVFPNSTFVSIKDSNHWIHIENENDLKEAIVSFMLKS